MTIVSDRVLLENVRLSFPSLFKPAVFNGVEGKYQATLLIPKKNAALKKKLDSMIAAVIAESKLKIPAEKLCLKDGDAVELEGYEDHWFLKASNGRRPTVINRDKTPITDQDNVIYPGCHVNAIVDFWIQNNQFGKRVNGNLYGVQFFNDGEPFGVGPIDVTDEFGPVEMATDL